MIKVDMGWQRCDANAFWNDVAPNDHVIQIYDDDTAMLEMLTGYALDGFYVGDSVIVLATAGHLSALNKKLTARGANLHPLIADGRYIPLNAEDVLTKFMVNGSPHEQYFIETLTPIIQRARKNAKKVRAFGEMVVVLWARGHRSATIQLEHIWNKVCREENICLLCAYPKKSFDNDASAAIMHICEAHSKQVGINPEARSEIRYKII